MGILSFVGDLLTGSKSSKSTKNTDTTTTRDPYAPTVPYLNDYLTSTANLYNGGAPLFSPEEQQGYDTLNKVAGDTSGIDSATAANNDTIGGKYLTPDTNPYLADIASRVSGLAGATTAAQFGGKGRSSGGLAGYYAGKAVGDSLTDLYGSEYNAERTRQQQAIGAAPQLEAGRYLAPQAMISAGQNISARPYDVNQQYGGILSQISQLGGTSHTVGTEVTKGSQTDPQSGVIGKITNSFVNKLFPGG